MNNILKLTWKIGTEVKFYINVTEKTREMIVVLLSAVVELQLMDQVC